MAGIVVLMVGLIAGVISLAIWADRAVCRSVGSISAVETRWEVLPGCFVKIEGQWIPLRRWVRVQK